MDKTSERENGETRFQPGNPEDTTLKHFLTACYLLNLQSYNDNMDIFYILSYIFTKTFPNHSGQIFNLHRGIQSKNPINISATIILGLGDILKSLYYTHLCKKYHGSH